MTSASRRYGTSCTYDFFSNRVTKTGVFFSPLYPQNYPPSSRCQYAFHGLPGEVVSLHFNSIRLDTFADRKYAPFGIPPTAMRLSVSPSVACLSVRTNNHLLKN